MKTSAASLLACLIVALCPAPLRAAPSVWCWAPGMQYPVKMNSLNLGLGLSLGRPYYYRIYGVAGTLSLGDQASGATADPSDSQRRFRKNQLLSLGSYVNSYSYVKLKVNDTRFYDQWLEVSGDRPNVTLAPVRYIGNTWIVQKEFGTPDTRLDFYLAGLGLGSLLGVDPPYYNLNPSGYFYVVGEYLATPPTPTGKITVSKNYVLNNASVPVTYHIDHGFNLNGETPPFTGYDPSGEVKFVAGN